MRHSFIRKLLIATVAALASMTARADLYYFNIDTYVDYIDPGRSIAIGSPSGGRISVFVPLPAHVHGPGIQDYLEHDAPPLGVIPTGPSAENVILVGTELPRPCPPGPPCAGALPWAGIYAMSLTADAWGHFEGTTWVPNPRPTPVSFCGPSLWGSPTSIECFAMFPVTVPEPGTLLLIALGILAWRAYAALAWRSLSALRAEPRFSS